VEIREPFHCFELEDDPILHPQIQAVGSRYLDLLVSDIRWYLALYPKPGLLQFVGQAGLVSAFQQARPQAALNLDGASQDHLGEGFQFKISALLRHSAFLRFPTRLFRPFQV
jgi:hypothetical protein